jgi:glucosyl-3-phosphoglycerate synthase
MADFWQGDIPTLHRLVAGQAGALADALQPVNGARRVSLVLPCHARDLHAPAFHAMLPALRGMSWLSRIVVGLDAGTVQDAAEADLLLADFPQETTVLNWSELPPPVGVSTALAAGKGLNVWRCLGWLFDQPDTEVIALQDCDISPYDPESLLRLVTPVARPEYGYRFAKGYYARFSDRLHGRLTRLLFQPLVAALGRRQPDDMKWRQLASWRYPLAGEIALDVALARQLRVHPRWGLETAMLLELPKLLATDEMCQVDLCERYDHRHQPLMAADAKPCLLEAADDIIDTLLEASRWESVGMTLGPLYAEHAAVAQRRSAQVAAINGLQYPEEEEEEACRQFAARVEDRADRFYSSAYLPAWASAGAEGSALHLPPVPL